MGGPNSGDSGIKWLRLHLRNRLGIAGQRVLRCAERRPWAGDGITFSTGEVGRVCSCPESLSLSRSIFLIRGFLGSGFNPSVLDSRERRRHLHDWAVRSGLLQRLLGLRQGSCRQQAQRRRAARCEAVSGGGVGWPAGARARLSVRGSQKGVYGLGLQVSQCSPKP